MNSIELYNFIIQVYKRMTERFQLSEVASQMEDSWTNTSKQKGLAHSRGNKLPVRILSDKGKAVRLYKDRASGHYVYGNQFSGCIKRLSSSSPTLILLPYISINCALNILQDTHCSQRILWLRQRSLHCSF